jgi:multiple sugar transport system permease protein
MAKSLTRKKVLSPAWKSLRTWTLSIVVWIGCLIWFSPVLWMFATSLKDSQAAVGENVPQWIPEHITWANYAALFAPASGISVLQGIANSLIVAGLSIVLTVLVCVPAAYALSRLTFRGKMTVFWAYVAILAFPAVLFLVPNYFIVHFLGMMDSYWALILPGLGGTFGVFMLRQYMLGISRDLEDAASIDGCSKTRFMVSIVVPFVAPALVVLSLMTFIGSWNSFLWPLLVLNSPDKLTFPIALVRFAAGWGDPFRGIGVLMAGAFLSTLPTLILFALFYRQLMAGVTVGSVGK